MVYTLRNSLGTKEGCLNISFYQRRACFTRQSMEPRKVKCRKRLENEPRGHSTVAYYLLLNNKKITYMRRHYVILSRLIQGRCWGLVDELRNNEVLADNRDTHKNRPQVVDDR